MVSIEELQQKVDDIKKWLSELKDDISISEKDKKKKAESFKSETKAIEKDIKSEIRSLEGKTDAESLRKKEEAEVLLNSCDSIMNLYESILKSQKSKSKEQARETEQEDSKENEGKKKLLRTVWLLWIGTWTLALIFNWKKLFGKDKEKKEEWDKDDSTDSSESKKDDKKKWMPRRKKFLWGAALTTWWVIWSIEIYKHRNRLSSRFKERLWLALPFDKAIQKVESEVRNWKVDADHFGAFNSHFEWWITYNEETKEICSYWQSTKIEKNWKKLQWMDVEFASWEELIHAANIVNFAKRRLKGRWATAKPFWQTSWWWDIQFACSARWQQEFMSASNSNEWSWILWTLWTTWWWILWGYCAWVKWAAVWAVWGWASGYALGAYIDNSSTAGRFCETISKWRNLDEFLIYLNNQTDENWRSLRESYGEQHINPEDTPISEVVDNWWEWPNWSWVLAEIEKEYWEDQTWRRNLEIKRCWEEPWGNHEEYRIKSYGHELKITIKWWPSKKWDKIDYSRVSKVHLEHYDAYECWNKWSWLNIDFPHTEKWLKEAIMVANLTNMIVEDREWKWEEAYPFAYWKYKFLFALEMDTDWLWTNQLWWTTILNNDKLKTLYPTLHQDLKKFPSTEAATIWSIMSDKFQRKMHNQAINDENTWSQYIKFLHQIWKGNFWKKIK